MNTKLWLIKNSNISENWVVHRSQPRRCKKTIVSVHLRTGIPYFKIKYKYLKISILIAKLFVDFKKNIHLCGGKEHVYTMSLPVHKKINKNCMVTKLHLDTHSFGFTKAMLFKESPHECLFLDCTNWVKTPLEPSKNDMANPCHFFLIQVKLKHWQAWHCICDLESNMLKKC